MNEYYRINFGTFNIDICICLEELSDTITKKQLIKNELRYSIKTYHYTHATKDYNNEDIIDIYGIDPKNTSWDNLISTVWDYDKPSYKSVSIVKLPSCEGCRLNSLSQYDHMDIGGCLYDPELY